MILALLLALLVSPIHAATFFPGGGGGTPAGATGQIQYNNAGQFGASASFTFNGTTLATAGYLVTSTITANPGAPIFIKASDAPSGQAGRDTIIQGGDNNFVTTNISAGRLLLTSGKATQSAVNAGQYSGDVVIRTADSNDLVGGSPAGATNVGAIIIESGKTKNTNVTSNIENIPNHTGIMIRGGYIQSAFPSGANVEIWGSSGTVATGNVNIHGGPGGSIGGSINLFPASYGAVNVTGNESVSGTLSAAHLTGEGSGVTGVTAVVTPAGNNTDVQYNNSGALGADDNFQWDSANRVLKINTVEFGWKKYSFDNTSFATASTSTEVTLFTLAPGAIIEGVKIKHSTEFLGGAISTYTLSVGLTGDSAKYASAFDVFSAAGSTNFQLTQDFVSEDHDNPTTVIVKALSGGDNLDQASQGNVDIWVKTSVAN